MGLEGTPFETNKLFLGIIFGDIFGHSWTKIGLKFVDLTYLRVT